MYAFFTRAITLISFLIPLSASAADNPANNARMLVKVMEKYHCCARPVNDEFSKVLFKEFISTTDPYKLIYTQSEIEKLKKYESSLDDELLGNDWLFLNEATALYINALKRAEAIVIAVSSIPNDFSRKESIRLSENEKYAADEKQLKEKWRLYLKLKTLKRISGFFSGDSVSVIDIKKINRQEPLEREKVKLYQLRKFNNVGLTLDKQQHFVSELYLKTISTCFDPHSEFMSPMDKENFEGHVSSDQLSFGIRLDENEQGEIFISHLIPGGPAWKSNELNKDDVLLNMQWKDKPVVDLTSSSLSEAYELMSESNHDELTLVVRKSNGVEKSVKLFKEKLRSDENTVKSFLLSGNNKVGYINLPGFYSRWENKDGSSCANDVAKEIFKLRKDSMQALILDLRYNGGGSMDEALDLAGLFIDEGPLCIVQSKDDKPRSAKDPNRGTFYTGPVLVLINAWSASASEVVAGALQDYNRAIIAGTPSFGKATAQVIFPMDTSYAKMAELIATGTSETGYVKATIARLFRVSGKTHQFNGIVPDIKLNGYFEKFGTRESGLVNALKPDSVKANSYVKPLTPLPLKSLDSLSQKRISGNDAFNAIKHYEDIASKFYDKDIAIPLSYIEYDAIRKSIQHEYEIMDEVMSSFDSTLFVVRNNAIDRDVLVEDEYRSELNQKQLMNIQTDPFLKESYHILSDYINIIND